MSVIARQSSPLALRAALAAVPRWGCVWLAGLCACAPSEPAAIETRDESLLLARRAAGKKLFERPFPGSNGRACTSCHVLSEGGTLHPENVEARLRETPDDPLFNRLDADDPAAPVPTFEHLKKGLVRVFLPLPDNMDVIDLEGNVVTPPDRTIFVWRGVPSVENLAMTAPYQIDGREPTLQSQAQGAISSHSEGVDAAPFQLDLLAEFQRGLFSSGRARFASALLDLGVPEASVPDPEQLFLFDAQERRGREVYVAACQGCHGGPSTDRIEQRELVDFLFPALTPEGNVLFDVQPGKPPVPVRVKRPGVNFMNVGFGALSYVGQLGLAQTFTSSVELPRYRFRFYKDGSRREAVVDLPPKPVTVSGSPFDPRPALDANGAPIVGPDLIPQAFTTDPGRAVVTGDPADFEALDVPQLRGVARTAPYFHDNSRETLEGVVDEYSRFVLPLLGPLLNLPIQPPEQPDGRPESLSPQQKRDLIAFLRRL